MKIDIEHIVVMLKKRFAVPNIILCIGILFLFGKIVSIWLGAYEAQKTDLSNTETSAKNSYVFNKREAALSSYEVIPQKNLFRPSRKEWTPPPPPKAKPKSNPKLKPTPPPEITISGIVRLGELSNRAIFQGRYFTPKDMKQKEIKKKGYKINDKIGQYRVSEIGDDNVVLVGPEGNPHTYTMKKNKAVNKELLNKPGSSIGKKLLGTAVQVK